MNTRPIRIEALERALAAAGDARRAGRLDEAIAALERAHVLGQIDFGRHCTVHLKMLGLAWARRDGREMAGQIMRLALIPLGHLTGRLPAGNTGGANVSAFEPMPIAPELQRLIDGP